MKGNLRDQIHILEESKEQGLSDRYKGIVVSFISPALRRCFEGADLLYGMDLWVRDESLFFDVFQTTLVDYLAS